MRPGAPSGCEWCRKPFPPGKRSHARTCSQPCRQALARFAKHGPPVVRPAPRDPLAPMRIGYADPPYPGLAHYYEGHPDYAGEVDHRVLVPELATTFPDGWALSTSAKALPLVLSICVEFLGADAVRVASWHRGPRGGRAKWPRSAWEPVIYAGGRRITSTSSTPPTDALVAGVSARLSDPARVIGAKPAPFAFWLFDLLGARPGDELVDLYPGSGGIARAWDLFCRAGQLESAHDALRAPSSRASEPSSVDEENASRLPGADASRPAIADLSPLAGAAAHDRSIEASSLPAPEASRLERVIH